MHPDHRCLNCREIMPGTAGRNYSPYCDEEECSRVAVNNPKCVLCEESLYKDYPSQKMHTLCKALHICPAPGCSVPVPARSGSDRKQSKYHSEACLRKAWEDQDYPICPLCKKPVELTTVPPYRDPDDFHKDCIHFMRSPKAAVRRETGKAPVEKFINPTVALAPKTTETPRMKKLREDFIKEKGNTFKSETEARHAWNKRKHQEFHKRKAKSDCQFCREEGGNF